MEAFGEHDGWKHLGAWPPVSVGFVSILESSIWYVVVACSAWWGASSGQLAAFGGEGAGPFLWVLS